MQQEDGFPIAVGLEVYLAFFAALIVVMVVLFTYLKRKERDERTAFFQQFDPSDLKMSPNQIGLVFRVLSTDGDMVTVVPVWRDKARIANGKPREIEAGKLIPFDEARFFF